MASTSFRPPEARPSAHSQPPPSRATAARAANSFYERRKKSEAARVEYLEKAKTIPEYNYDNTVAFDEDARELDPEDTD